MEEKIRQLKTILAEISDLNYASALLGWDQQTYMPVGGAEARGYQAALLERLAHGRALHAARPVAIEGRGLHLLGYRELQDFIQACKDVHGPVPSRLQDGI